MKSDHDKIAEKAYQKYIERGCLDGYDQQDWFEAEQAVKNAKKKPGTKSPMRKSSKGKK